MKDITITERLIEVLSHLPPSKKLKELEKVAMAIRKENSIRINKAVEVTKSKYPKK